MGDSLNARTLMGLVEKIAEDPEQQEERRVQDHLCPIYEPVNPLPQIFSDEPALSWSRLGICELEVFVARMSYEAAYDHVHDTKDKGDE
jgi:hypothetical protein